LSAAGTATAQDLTFAARGQFIQQVQGHWKKVQQQQPVFARTKHVSCDTQCSPQNQKGLDGDETLQQSKAESNRISVRTLADKTGNCSLHGS